MLLQPPIHSVPKMSSEPPILIRRRDMLGAAGAVGLSSPLMAKTKHFELPDTIFRIVLGSTAGGAVDAIARLLARHLGTATGRTFLVENRPGANGVQAADWVSQADNTGVKLLMGLSSQLLLNQLLYTRMPLDLRTDLSRVYKLAEGILYLCVNAQKTPVASLEQLPAHVRSKQGKLSYGSFGMASYTHLMGERLNQLLNAQMVHVPYKGETPLTLALLAGEVDLGWASPLQFKQYPGQLRALASNGDGRMPGGLPGVPSFAEGGIRDEAFSLQGWLGLVMSSKAPEHLKNAISDAIVHVMRHSDIVAQCAAMGLPLNTDSSPQQFETFYQSEYPKWERLVRQVNITLD